MTTRAQNRSTAIRSPQTNLASALAIALSAAQAQSQIADPLRRPAATAPAPQPAQPSAPKALLPAAPRAAPAAPPADAAGPSAVPADLFKMDDRAIIIVGGKPRAAADVRREIQAELQRLSGPPKTARTPARPAPVQPMQASPAAPGAKVLVQDALRARPAATTDWKEVCRANPPQILRVRGALTPNQRFTIEGGCFGDTTGAVEVIGQFPGGSMKLVFERWTQNEIVGFVPEVVGAADHAVALTVVRADRARSPAAQARFVATRVRVPVAQQHWSPADTLNLVESGPTVGGKIVAGQDKDFEVTRVGAHAYATPMTVSINRACALDYAEWTVDIGQVNSVDGWTDDGPPHEARVRVVWTPHCVTRTERTLLLGWQETICGARFALKAWALCPIGLAP